MEDEAHDIGGNQLLWEESEYHEAPLCFLRQPVLFRCLTGSSSDRGHHRGCVCCDVLHEAKEEAFDRD